MLVTAAKQLNPSTFPNPLEFNPWRWKVSAIFQRIFVFRDLPFFFQIDRLLFKPWCLLFRSLTHMLYQRILHLLEEEWDNVLELSLLELLQLFFSMSLLPNIGTTISSWIFFYVCTNVKFAAELINHNGFVKIINRWKVTKVGKIGRNPILRFGEGIHIKFSEKEI